MGYNFLSQHSPPNPVTTLVIGNEGRPQFTNKIAILFLRNDFSRRDEGDSEMQYVEDPGAFDELVKWATGDHTRVLLMPGAGVESPAGYLFRRINAAVQAAHEAAREAKKAARGAP